MKIKFLSIQIKKISYYFLVINLLLLVSMLLAFKLNKVYAYCIKSNVCNCTPGQTWPEPYGANTDYCDPDGCWQYCYWDNPWPPIPDPPDDPIPGDPIATPTDSPICNGVTPSCLSFNQANSPNAFMVGSNGDCRGLGILSTDPKCTTNNPSVKAIYGSNCAREFRFYHMPYDQVIAGTYCSDVSDANFMVWLPYDPSYNFLPFTIEFGGLNKICFQFKNTHNGQNILSPKCGGIMNYTEAGLSTCEVHGTKRIVPYELCENADGNCSPARDQGVFLNAVSPDRGTGWEYYFDQRTISTHTLSANVPYKYNAGSSTCQNNWGCHAIPGSFPGSPAQHDVSVTCPAEAATVGFAGSDDGDDRFVSNRFYYRPEMGTINVYAKYVPNFTTCINIGSQGTYLNTTIQLPRKGGGDQVLSYYSTDLEQKSTTSGGSPASWSNAVIAYSHTPSDISLPVNYTPEGTCWVTPGSTFFQPSIPTTAWSNGQTASAYIIYSAPDPWVQTRAGDVYANTSITSAIPSMGPSNQTSPLRFALDGAGAYPGVVNAGSGNYDFSFNGANDGVLSSNLNTYLSSQRWIASDQYLSRDYYKFYYDKVSPPTTPVAGPAGKPTALATNSIDDPDVYHYTSLTIQSGTPWSVQSGEYYIIFVNGNMTVSDNITVADGGFIAFIVNGNITITSGVGHGPVLNPNPDVAGVYISEGTLSAEAGNQQLVGKGVFLVESVSLDRDLAGDNEDYPAHLFIWDPILFMNIPDALKDVPYTWQEVAP